MNWRRLLFPFSWLYIIAVFIRNKLFDFGILKSVRFEVPVICVGNLRAGGEGKSPHIEYLVRLLQDEFKVATLSRGYKRKTKDFQLATPHSEAADIGDEPLQFSKKFPGITVAVDKDRALGITNILAAHENTGVILLDDAFQHRYVQAGINILITSYHNLYTNDWMLPAGNLREPASGARRAHVIIVSKCPETLTHEQMQAVQQKLKPGLHQQVYFTGIRYENLKLLNETPQMLPSPQSSCLLLTGIANPDSLKKQCKKNYKEVVHLGFSDHHAFSRYDIALLRKKFDAIPGTEKFILTTEKDAMRLSSAALQPYLKNLPLYYLPISIRFLEKEEQFKEQIKKYVRSHQTNH